VDGFLLCLFIGARSYVTTSARIDFLEDRIQMLLAISRREIVRSSIQSVEISRSSFAPMWHVYIRPRSGSEHPAERLATVKKNLRQPSSGVGIKRQAPPSENGFSID
jgi:hypothetical protein